VQSFFCDKKGKKMNKLLLNESPLIILPSLALEIGLNEAIFLQQLHYWMLKSSTNFDARNWVYRTTKEWEKEFPFWSISTIKRIISSLKKRKILEVKRVYPHVYYSINEENIGNSKGQSEPLKAQNEPPKVQNEPSKSQNEPSKVQFDPSPIYNENQRDYTEITQKSTTESTHRLMYTWNEFALKNSLSQISVLSANRKKCLQHRLKNSEFTELFNQALEEIKKSKYLLGEKGWKVGFDWLIKNDENILKVVEGNYQDKQQKNDYANSPLNNLPEPKKYVVEEW